MLIYFEIYMGDIMWEMLFFYFFNKYIVFVYIYSLSDASDLKGLL